MYSKIKSVILFKVGQGDNILLEFQDNTAAVVDFFYSKEQHHPPAFDYILSTGIKIIRFIHITHYDLDHIKGLSEFIVLCNRNKIKIEKAYFPPFVLPISFNATNNTKIPAIQYNA